MKKTDNKQTEKDKAADEALLNLAAQKLRGRELFPKHNERARQLMRRLKSAIVY